MWFPFPALQHLLHHPKAARYGASLGSPHGLGPAGSPQGLTSAVGTSHGSAGGMQGRHLAEKHRTSKFDLIFTALSIAGAAGTSSRRQRRRSVLVSPVAEESRSSTCIYVHRILLLTHKQILFQVFLPLIRVLESKY